ncbi:hypothetical protein M8J76_008517 [Diaphorina citri]|jgi:hypothetical protein|nr:hypothetical protein M8J75_004573 [Diaphorina citri]KAI5729966.1 hypothetical protein M8J76_008517 [Diaphorina citri]KAI5735606.1 hypothetical protein M8J77_020547 [Diaphorina citri]
MRTLVFVLTLQCLQVLSIKEVFNSELLAKVRAGESFTVSASSTIKDKTAKNINFVWKITRQTTTKEFRHQSKDEIFNELVFSFSDRQYRSNWFTAMRTGWDKLVNELRATGPGPFMKKRTMDDKRFVGEVGLERWKEVIEYIQKLTEDEKMYFINRVAHAVEKID